MSVNGPNSTWARTNHSLQREVLVVTPWRVAATDALINGKALFTLAQRSALAQFAICPLPSCPATINTIDYVFARVDGALF